MRVDRPERIGGAGHQRLVGAHIAGRSPSRFEPLPQRQHQVGRAEDGRALAAPACRDVGERPHGRRVAGQRHHRRARRTATRRGRRRRPRTGRPSRLRSSRPARTGPPPCTRRPDRRPAPGTPARHARDRGPGRNSRSASGHPWRAHGDPTASQHRPRRGGTGHERMLTVGESLAHNATPHDSIRSPPPDAPPASDRVATTSAVRGFTGDRKQRANYAVRPG